MVRRQRGKLLAPAREKCVGADKERIVALLRKGRKGRIDLAIVLALRISICSPMAAAAACTSLQLDSAIVDWPD